MFELTSEKIDRDQLIASLQNDKAGALVVFEGWVRDHNEGKKVSSLEYQVYEALARKEGEKILHEAMHKFNLHQVHCTHRFGHLLLGETAVWVGAVASHRDEAFKATRFVIDEIKHRLPVWKKEHYVDQKPEWVFCKDHHHHVHFEEADYYQKQSRLTQQQKLKSARVVVIGAGGLGCPVLTGIVSAGVGHVDIVDFDRISLSNIHRQPLYSPDLVGEKKAIVARNKMTALNPFIHVHAHDFLVNATNVEKLISGKDLVIDCTDNLETKYLLHDACFKTRTPLISASIYQFEGQIRTFVPESPTGCLRCLNSVTPDDGQLGNCNDYGVLGASVAVLGSLQASEALHFLQTGSNNTMEKTFFFDLRTLTQMKITQVRQEGCATCAGDIVLHSSPLEVEAQSLEKMDAVLVDVRDFEDQHLDNYLHSEKPVVVCCHRGVRSKRLVEGLREKGHTHFYSLKGGACSL